MPNVSAPIPELLDPPAPPVHVAIIMDGNGRWASARGLPRIEGHRQGAEAVRRTVESAAKFGIQHLTLFGFSSENWQRPENEVSGLMGLLRLYLRREVAELTAKGVRLRFIGDRGGLSRDIVELMESAEQRTLANTRLNLNVALNYGSRNELVHAARMLAEAALAGNIKPGEIGPDDVTARLETADLPDPDLLIRTSGEQRISNFLLWQCAYTEFIFLDTLWPDFGEADLANAITDYQRRDRRFGAIGV